MCFICFESENKVSLWVFAFVLFSFMLLKENNDTDKEMSLSEREKQRLKWKKASCRHWCSGVKAITTFVCKYWKYGWRGTVCTGNQQPPRQEIHYLG